MSIDKNPIIDADKVEKDQPTHQETPKKEKKKHNLKFHLILTLILGVSTWAFITYSQTANDWKQQCYDFTHQPKATYMDDVAPQQPEITMQAEADAEVKTESQPQLEETTQELNAAPIFEATTEPLESSEANLALPITSLSDITSSIQNMYAQINILQQTVSQLQQQQLHWSQQQVRAQLFSLLQQASLSQGDIHTSLLAWKNISFLPLLSPEKREIANQAYDSLYTLQQDMLQTENNIQSLITSLAEQLQPKDLKEVAQSVQGLTDPYQQVDTFNSWLDWIQQQFVISKIDKHALDISDDPFAELKQLISDLDALNQSVKQAKWQGIQSLTSLFYRLEQRGLEAKFSRETIGRFEQESSKWQQEAQLWMEQL